MAKSSSPDWTNRKAKEVLASIMWQHGDLRFKFKPAQRQMHFDIFNNSHMKYVVKCSRRLGKTFMLCCIAIMKCLKQPGALVRYAAPTHKALKKFIIPVMNIILKDCPDELRPEWKSSDGVYQFKNGSQIHLAGVNNDNADSLRGTYADLFIIDEAGFVDGLRYLIDDVALPQFLDPDGKIVAGRRIVISGSPARTPAHEFTEICREAESQGNLSHYDIYAGGYPEETIEIYKKESGGENSTTWKREYLALDVVDENYALVPEWKPEYIQTAPIDGRFKFWQKYVALDIGVRDLTVALFAYYDFSKATLFVLDEVVMNGTQMTTQKLADAIRHQEQLTFQGLEVFRRISDVDLLLLNDLRSLHALYFNPTDKGKLEEMVNEVRIWVNSGRIIVAPHCKQTIGCLGYGVWNEKRNDFDRSPVYGHFDAMAALMYLIRNVDQRTNPVPITYGKSKEDVWIPLDYEVNSNKNKLKKAFGVK